MASLEENLHRACERKDPYLVHQLLTQGADISSPDPKRNNITPLIRAAMNNSSDIVIIILFHASRHSEAIYQLDDQGFNAFHWAIIKGHLETISVMSFLNPVFLTKPDKWNRPPAYLFQTMKPLPHVLRFMMRWYPNLFPSVSNLIVSPSAAADRPVASSPIPKKKTNLFLLLSSDDHHSDDSDSDLERSSDTSPKKKSSPKLRHTSTLLSSCCRCSLCRLSIPQINSFSRVCCRWFSSLISKNSEELSKLPFRCFFGSILLSLYYVTFVFYPLSPFLSSSIPLLSSSLSPPSYKSSLIFAANVIGQLWMWSSFLITHLIGRSCSSLPLPEVCHQDYREALTTIASFYATPPTSGRPSALPHLPSVCHHCRVLVPLRAKHCKEENSCLLTFDHYCSFLWAPIYRCNYLHFFSYLLAMNFYIPTFLFTSTSYIRYHQPSSRALAYFLIWCFIQWMFVFCLLLYFTQSLSLGQTTYERIKQPFYLNKKNRRRTKSKKGTSWWSWSGTAAESSPFNLGSFWKNLLQHRREMCAYGAAQRYLNKEELNLNCHIFFQLDELLQWKGRGGGGPLREP
jgi:hypothetical protein